MAPVHINRLHELSENDKSPPNGSPGSSGSEIADALADVLQDQARHAEARERAEVPRDRSSPLHWVVLAVLFAFNAYLWLASPEWLQPEPPPEPSLELEEAGLRIEMYMQAARIEAFREAEGRLPATLLEAGEPIEDIEYERIDARTYQLRAASERMSLEYVSTDRLETLLANAREVIRRARQ